MNVQTVVVGNFQTNCYIVKKEGKVLFIDPGKNSERLASYIDTDDKVVAILLTHGHFDHIGAVDDLAKQFHCPIYIHKEDVKMINNCPSNSMMGLKASVKQPVIAFDKDRLTIDCFDIDCIHSPGHTEGSVCYVIENCLFSGDVLFKGCIGRCDLEGGNMTKMKQSLKQLITLDDSLIVYPGHEESSTLREEMDHNPYLLRL